MMDFSSEVCLPTLFRINMVEKVHKHTFLFLYLICCLSAQQKFNKSISFQQLSI